MVSTAHPFSYLAFDISDEDTLQKKKDTLKFPIEDRIGDKFNEDPPVRFDLKDPKNINTEVEYDPSLKEYSITEKIGKEYYRAPSYMTYEEFLKFQAGKDEEAYFKKRQNTIAQISKKGGIYLGYNTAFFRNLCDVILRNVKIPSHRFLKKAVLYPR